MQRRIDLWRSNPVTQWSAAVLLATLLTACGNPPYPDEQVVLDRVKQEYHDASCELTKLDSPQLQPDQPNQPFLFLHLRFEARCKDANGKMEPLTRTQIWKRYRKRPTLLQGAWRWEPAGEISG